MKLTVKAVLPASFYDGRTTSYRVQVETVSGQRLECLDPSVAASFLRPGDQVDGLLTALRYSLSAADDTENCLTGIVRSALPLDPDSPYRNLVNHHFIGLETIDGVLFLYHDEKSGIRLPDYDGRILTVHITGGLYLELMLSDQFAV